MAERETERPGARATRRTTLAAEVRPMVAIGTTVLVVGCLYWGQAVLIPIALAGMFAFLLSPVVGALDRLGARRAVSVLVVVLLTFCLTGIVGWVLFQQVVTLADELPQYRANIRQRVADIRGFGKGGAVEKVQRTLSDVVGEVQKGDAESGSDKPIPVVVEPPATFLSKLPGLLDTLGTVSIVTVLVIFILLERQELRNRLIRLVGYRRLTVTTKALDEAAMRISRYLLMQSIINGSFGVAVGLGLFLLGIPYAALWGFLAAVLRFIPYVGPLAAVVLPTALALAVFPGWSRPVIAIGMFLALELVANMVLEPWLYGQSAGVSQIALLVAVIFWTWLWGAVGLLLATPLTVCLIVLAKHLPSLNFLVLLMGEEPVLEPKARYYQRLLARDRDEASDIVEEYVDEHDKDAVYDDVLLPALSFARQDSEREQISDEDADFVARATRELTEEMGRPVPLFSAGAARREGDDARLLLLCPARDDLDEVALTMAAQLLDRSRWHVEMLGAGLLTAEVAQIAEERRPAAICIGAVAPGGTSHAKHLCKRVRARCPELSIVVGRWGVVDEQESDAQQLAEAGADRVAPTLLALKRHLDELSLLEPATPEGAEQTSAPVPVPA